MKTLLAFLLPALVHFTAAAQVRDWEEKLNQNLSAFTNCMASKEKAVCQTYTANVIKTIYSINDFNNAATKTDMTPHEMLEALVGSTKWTKLGMAYEATVLTKAQELCNAGKPVLVVFKGASPSDTHISIMLPGTLQTSGSWGMKVPNVAALFTHKPENSFVNKALSYAYSKSMMLQLEVYGRN